MITFSHEVTKSMVSVNKYLGLDDALHSIYTLSHIIHNQVATGVKSLPIAALSLQPGNRKDAAG